jgi:hypothetical protein
MELIDVIKAFAPYGDFHGSEKYGRYNNAKLLPYRLQ